MTVRVKKGLATNLTGAELFTRQSQKRPGYVFQFDGTDQYATIPAWRPNGLPFEVSVNGVPLTVDATPRRLFGNPSGSDYSVYSSSATQWVGRWKEQDGTLQVLTATTGSLLNQTVRASLATDTTKTQLDVNTTSLDKQEKAGIQNAVTAIAGTAAGAQLFHGPIWDVRLTDYSPIQNTWVVNGNATRYVQLENPIVLAGDFEIEFEWIRRDTASGTSRVGLMGSSGSTFLNVYVRDTNNASSPSSFFFETGEQQIFVGGAFDNVALGQHCRCKFSVSGSNWTFEIDGAVVGSGGNYAAGNAVIGLIGNMNTPALLPADSSLANVRITDITNSLRWHYPLTDPTKLNAEIGNQRNLIKPEDDGAGLLGFDDVHGQVWPETYGLNGTEIREAKASIDDLFTLVLSDDNIESVPVLVFEKFKYPLAKLTDVNHYAATIPGIRQAFEKAAAAGDVGVMEFTEPGLTLTARDAPNVDPSTRGQNNGIWQPDAEYRFIPLNSRHYPINEGSGSVIKNVNDSSGNTDGAIVGNNDDSSWVVMDK